MHLKLPIENFLGNVFKTWRIFFLLINRSFHLKKWRQRWGSLSNGNYFYLITRRKIVWKEVKLWKFEEEKIKAKEASDVNSYSEVWKLNLFYFKLCKKIWTKFFFGHFYSIFVPSLYSSKIFVQTWKNIKRWLKLHAQCFYNFTVIKILIFRHFIHLQIKIRAWKNHTAPDLSPINFNE